MPFFRLAVILGCVACFVLATASLVTAEQAKRPNIIFILTDDQGWSSTSIQMHPEMSASKEPYFETPAIERLALEGRRFSSGYAPAPLCTPTRRSVLVGMSTARTRGSEFASEFDPKPHLTIPRALKKVDPNYRCAHFGKWGEQMNALPDEVGYDESDGDTGNLTGNRGLGIMTAPNGRPAFDRSQPMAICDDPKLTDTLTKRSIDFIERQTKAGKPFYLQLSAYAVHNQLQANEATAKKYEAKGTPPRDFPPIFAAMMEDMDAGIGQILDALDRLKIADNTYIFLSADNGGSPHQLFGMPKRDEYSPQSPNYPLRGYKQDLLEGGIRVPFIVRGPGIAPGSWCHEPVAQYDLLPTFVELAGGNSEKLLKEANATIDGGSFKSLLLEGKGEVKRPLPGLVFHRPDKSVSVYRSGDMKVYHDWWKDETYLYDLSKDIGEQKDLAAEQPEKFAEMKTTLMTYLKEVNAEEYSRERILQLREQQRRLAANQRARAERERAAEASKE